MSGVESAKPKRTKKRRARSKAAAEPPSPALRLAPRYSLGLVDVLHAAVFGAAAWTLPWPTLSVFAVLGGMLALMHAARAALALGGHPWGWHLFRYGAFASLAVLAYMVWGLTTSAVYVARLYGTLGQGVAAAAAAIGAVGVLFTVPIAAWGLGATGGLPTRSRGARGAAVLVVVVLLADFVRWDRMAAAEPLVAGQVFDTAEHALSPERLEWQPRDEGAERVSLFVSTPIECPEGAIRAAVAFAGPRAQIQCVAADTLEEVGNAVRGLLVGTQAKGPVKIDVFEAEQPLSDLGPWLGMLSLRPGLDGVCGQGKCLMPWQLVALDQFTRFSGVSEIQLRFGVTPFHLRQALGLDLPPDGEASFEGLTRLTTRSFLIDDGGELRELTRLRDGGPELAAPALQGAVEDALRFILDVQERDGRFGYIVDPFRGTVSYANFSVPRQAGTTLAICEIGKPSDTRVDDAAAASLTMLGTLERRIGDVGALVYPAGALKPGRLGDTALPLIAFLACRERVGAVHDERIDRLGRMLLSLQRPDGSFHPEVDIASGDPIPGPDPMYAEGQVVMALLLWEAAPVTVPKPEGLTAAVDRAMDYFSGPYWDYLIRDYFFLEENWHCLAARAALSHHRHDAYERFCIDYVTMKARLTFDEDSDVDPDLLGAYGFGNVLPPHNTATAGYGEALAAKMALLEARGEDRAAEIASMERTLSFLLAQQWQPSNCFACSTRRDIVGGFSEHVGSPQIRIDYVQHALAAMGHGGRMLGLIERAQGG